MRLAGPDIVLFVIGALLFGGATYAIVSSPGGAGGQASALGVFEVTYETETVDLAEESVSMRSGTADFAVDEPRVVSLLVTVSCNDQAAGPASFAVQVSVEGPNGLTGEGSGACAGDGVVVEVPIAPAPAATTVPGSTEAEARENLDGQAAASNATGTWTVTVSGSRNGLPGLPVGDPNGTIALQAEVATPRFAPVQR